MEKITIDKELFYTIKSERTGKADIRAILLYAELQKRAEELGANYFWFPYGIMAKGYDFSLSQTRRAFKVLEDMGLATRDYGPLDDGKTRSSQIYVKLGEMAK